MILEYTGKQAAAITFLVRGRPIRAGNNSRDRIIEVSEEEAALLLGNHGALFRKVEAVAVAEAEESAPDRFVNEPLTTIDLATLRAAGISATLATALATRYADATALQSAPDEELLAIEGLGPATLLKVREALK